MKKLAIIGASYLQEPLIQKAKKRGVETHVFAWASGDVGEKSADFFYPISIMEKEEILNKCIDIGIDGVCSIASDLAIVTANYVANRMGLIGNSPAATEASSNKQVMRRSFERNGDPSPKSIPVTDASELEGIDLRYPIIVKPVDRSGSRGITKLEDASGLTAAIQCAKEQGFEKVALVEEFVSGQEYSVEYISWKGQHTFLALTKKYTTSAPHFIETGHIEPADVETDILEKVKRTVEHALAGLGIEYGASHSEIKITESGDIYIIEIGGRMGGDFIGSTLVELTTGYDFVSAVIDIALGVEPNYKQTFKEAAAVRFVFSQTDIECLAMIKKNDPDLLIEEDIHEITSREVTDSASRFGYFLLAGKRECLLQYMPEEEH